MFRNSLSSAVATIESLAALEDNLLRAVDLVRTALLAGNKLLVAGNGGSAADAMDFSTEYTCRFSGDRRPFPAINLATDGSLMAAIGNDYAFEEVFARQVWAFGKPGDVLVVYSTSGKSPNILRALDEAKKRGLVSIAFLGRDGGPAAGRATVDLIVPAEVTARIQEAHKFLAHCICEQVDGDLKKAS
jgi:D-sedoheptulose 7-phosphate isomerase